MGNYFVHESAYVDDGAEVGEGTKIWHFCHVMGKAKIGNNCSFGQNVFVANHVVIGNGCKIQNNVSLYEQGCFILGSKMRCRRLVASQSPSLKSLSL